MRGRGGMGGCATVRSGCFYAHGRRRAISVAAAFLLLASLLQLSSAASANPLCPINPSPSYLDIITEPPIGPGSIVSTYVYNISSQDYIKNGLSSALIILVNQTNLTSPNICYGVADAEGWTNFTYDSNLEGCTNYWFIFCPLGRATLSSDEGLAARQTCLNGTGLPQALINQPISKKCGSGDSPTFALSNYLPSHNQFYICTEKPKSYAGLCWPLMLIFALLLGADFAMGKNPFQAFDFSAMRMNRGRQYTMRTQQKSLDATSLVMAIDKATDTASGGKGGVITSTLGNLVSKGMGAGLDALGITGKVKTDGNGNILGENGKPNGLTVEKDGKTVKDQNNKIVGTVDKKGNLKLNDGPIKFLTQDGKTVDGKASAGKIAADSIKDAQILAAQANRAMSGAGLIATATSPDLTGLGGMFRELYNAVAGKSSGTQTELNKSYDKLFGGYNDKGEKNRLGDDKGAGSRWAFMTGKMGAIIGESLKNMFRFTDANGSFNIGNSIKSLLNMFSTYKMLAMYSRGLLETTGAGKMDRITGVTSESGISLLGRKMSIGEISDWIENPNTMPLLLSWLAPAVGTLRDTANLQLTSQPPPGVMVAARDFQVENKKYTVIKENDGTFVVFDSEGKRVNRHETASVIRAIGGAEGYEKTAKEFQVGNKKYTVDTDSNGNLVVFGSDGKRVNRRETASVIRAIGGAEGYENAGMTYLRVEHGIAHSITKDDYVRLCDRMEQWNEARNKIMEHLVSAETAGMSGEEQRRLMRVSGMLGDEKLWKAKDEKKEDKNDQGMGKEDAAKLKALGNDQVAYLSWKIGDISAKLEKKSVLTANEREILVGIIGTDVAGLNKMSIRDQLTVLNLARDEVSGGRVASISVALQAGGVAGLDAKDRKDLERLAEQNHRELGKMSEKEIRDMIGDFKMENSGVMKVSRIETLQSAMRIVDAENETLRNAESYLSDKKKMNSDTFAALQGNENAYRYLVNKEAEQWATRDFFAGHMEGGMFRLVAMYADPVKRQEEMNNLAKQLQQINIAKSQADEAGQRQYQMKIDALQNKLDFLQVIDGSGISEKDMKHANGMLAIFAMQQYQQNELETGVIMDGVKKGMKSDDLQKLIGASLQGLGSKVGPDMDVAKVISESGEKQRMFSELRNGYAIENKEARDIFFGLGAAALEKSGNEATDKNKIALFKAAALVKNDETSLLALSKKNVADTNAVLKAAVDTEIASIERLRDSVTESSKARQFEVDGKKYVVAKDRDKYVVYDEDGSIISNRRENASVIRAFGNNAEGYEKGTLVNNPGDPYKGSYIKPKELLDACNEALGKLTELQNKYYDGKERYSNYEQSYRQFADGIGSFAAQLAGDEERARAYSVGGVRGEMEAARPGVWSASTYMQYAAGDAFNQARGGGFFNAENSAYALSAALASTVTFGILSPTPELPKYGERVEHQADIISHIFGGTVYAPEAGVHRFEFTPQDLGKPPEAPKPVEVPKPAPQPTTEYFQGFKDLTTISQFSTLNYQTNVPVGKEERVAWFGGLKKLTTEAQMTKATDSGRFMDSIGAATAEQTGNFLQHQLVLNPKTQAYDIRPADQNGFVVDDKGQNILDSNGTKIRGYTDAQIGVWMLHNTTNTIRVYSSKVDFADAEFKTALGLDAVMKAATPEARAEAVLDYANTDAGRAQLIKDQDLKHNVITTNDDGTKTTHHVSMNKADKEWTGDRIDKVLDLYNGWQETRQPQSTTTEQPSQSAKQEAPAAEPAQPQPQPTPAPAAEPPPSAKREAPPPETPKPLSFQMEGIVNQPPFAEVGKKLVSSKDTELFSAIDGGGGDAGHVRVEGGKLQIGRETANPIEIPLNDGTYRIDRSKDNDSIHLVGTSQTITVSLAKDRDMFEVQPKHIIGRSEFDDGVIAQFAREVTFSRDIVDAEGTLGDRGVFKERFNRFLENDAKMAEVMTDLAKDNRIAKDIKDGINMLENKQHEKEFSQPRYDRLVRKIVDRFNEGSD